MSGQSTFGAWPDESGVRFRVWAPGKRLVDLVLDAPESRTIALHEQSEGIFSAFVPGLEAGARYRYRVDGQGPFPDPASRFQPEGVHGPSEVIDPAQRERIPDCQAEATFLACKLDWAEELRVSLTPQ